MRTLKLKGAKRKLSKNKCLRCGQCCIWFDPVALYWKECRFLARDNKGFTTCMKYHKRIGTCLSNFYTCNYREDIHWNFPDCLYNKENWPMHPAYEEVKKE